MTLRAELREKITRFVEENIIEYQQARVHALTELKLSTLLAGKNPYLFRAKNLNIAGDLISALLSARMSSAEEGAFGRFLEELAIFVATETSNAETSGIAQKAGVKGIDIELMRDGKRYLIAVKSGKQWSNASSMRQQKQNFIEAVRVIKQSKHSLELVPTLGICYGKFKTVHNGLFLHIGGQSFWHLLSGDLDFYTEVLEPLGHQAEVYDAAHKAELAKTHNRLTREFISEFCSEDGAVDWVKLTRAVSGNMNS